MSVTRDNLTLLADRPSKTGYRTYRPLYRQVAQKLEQAIAANDFAQGQLPTEGELAERFEVSRITIRQALKILIDKGLIYQRPRQGTFLRGVKAARPATRTRTLGWLKLHDLEYASAADTAIVDRFEQMHPGWRLEVRRIGRDAAPGEREQAIQSADVLSMDVAGLGRLAQRGLLADLSRHKALQAEIAGAWPAALSICRHRGALVALPRNLNVTALHCNRTIFQEAGIDPAACASWEGLTRALGRLKAKRGGHPLWRLGYFHYPTLYWENFLWQHEAEVFAPGTARCVLGQPAAITAIQEAASVLHRVGKDHVRDLSVWPERFLGENQAGDIACFVGEPLFCQFLANAADEWMSLPLPTSGKPACSGAGFCVGVRHPARSEAEAMNLLKLICGPFGQDLLAIHNAAMPAQQESARRYFNVPARNDRSGFVASAPNARMAMPWVYHPAVDALLRNEMPRILQNPDGVAAGCRRVEQILNLMELDARTLWPHAADGTT